MNSKTTLPRLDAAAHVEVVDVPSGSKNATAPRARTHNAVLGYVFLVSHVDDHRVPSTSAPRQIDSRTAGPAIRQMCHVPGPPGLRAQNASIAASYSPVALAR